MSRELAVGVLAVAVAFPAPAWAQRDPAVDLAVGIRQIQDGDLEPAVKTLEKVIQELSAQKGREKDLARAHLYLGAAHLGLDHTDRARAEMREAWMNNKDMKVDAKEFSPRVRQLYELAKSEAKDQAKVESAGEGVKQPAVAPPAPKATAGGPAARPIPPVVGVALGTRIRVSAPATSNKPVVGRITSFDDRSLTIRRENGNDTFNVPVTSASRFEISSGHASKGRRALFWGLGGAVLAGGAGAAYGNVRSPGYCSGRYCYFGSKRGVGKWGGIGAGSGAVIGAVIGSLTAGENWKPAEKVQVGLSLGRRGVLVAVRF